MSSSTRPRMTGIGRVLVIVYAIMALAYTLSAASAVVYILATLALVFAGSEGWYVVAWVAICFELAGVLVIGTLSLVLPELFAHPTVWSEFGSGYLFVPLVLPFFGIWWLATHRPASTRSATDAPAPVVAP